MAKAEKLSPEDKLKAQIKQLQRQVAMRDAMVLDRYPEPNRLDVDKELAATEDRSRLGLPIIHVWVPNVNGTVEVVSTTKDLGVFVYATERDALVALRNKTMTAAVVKCATLDRKIAKLQDERFTDGGNAVAPSVTTRTVAKHPALGAPYGAGQKPGLPVVDQLVAAIRNSAPAEDHDPLPEDGEPVDPLADDSPALAGTVAETTAADPLADDLVGSTDGRIDPPLTPAQEAFVADSKPVLTTSEAATTATPAKKGTKRSPAAKTATAKKTATKTGSIREFTTRSSTTKAKTPTKKAPAKKASRRGK